MTDQNAVPAPRPSADELRSRLAAELALPSRVGYTALLLAGLTVAAVTGSLLATEAGLPGRTQAAFVVVASAGLAWAALAAWVLARRRVLFASHRVMAGRMSVTCTALFTAGALTVWLLGSRQQPGALAAAAVGAAMLAVAVVVLLRARRRVLLLTARKREIERLLAREAR
ncbi:MAG TPA: hypothetical protein VK912_16050 [Longimicrobiales bacterium]|nr:hypothetical protein [Longimicrobiales bacterium]